MLGISAPFAETGRSADPFLRNVIAFGTQLFGDGLANVIGAIGRARLFNSAVHFIDELLVHRNGNELLSWCALIGHRGLYTPLDFICKKFVDCPARVYILSIYSV